MGDDLKGLKLVNKAGDVVSPDTLKDKAVAFYFSAHWCPPCRQFTPMLKAFHTALKEKGADFEVIFVSRDRSDAEMQSYFQTDHGDWLAVAFDDASREKLCRRFGVQGIPYLAVCDPSGEPLIPPQQARMDVQKAAMGSNAFDIFKGWSG
eukprot:TRINITY_DN428_c0_g1_i1.p1 TRINITY_DN428_c0_g1~~TRINITY_DN428_c0_g1_i1.p1  ORF type:complete len:172 (+),score=65.19 TRINITY_DN428_c0_g1_i1:69-518(+)